MLPTTTTINWSESNNASLHQTQSGSGRQVLITTHDSDLARQIHTIHHHRGTDEFKAYLLEPPRDGTQVLRSGDEFEHLLLDAESQMHSPLESNRRAAGNYLRVAAERLSKHVIARGRRAAGDLSAQISDYDNKNLRDLAPLASGYVVDSNEPGQWQMFARLLNDANHDATPPLPAELKQCHSSLKHIKRRHLQQDPDLMKP